MGGKILRLVVVDAKLQKNTSDNAGIGMMLMRWAGNSGRSLFQELHDDRALVERSRWAEAIESQTGNQPFG